MLLTKIIDIVNTSSQDIINIVDQDLDILLNTCFQDIKNSNVINIVDMLNALDQNCLCYMHNKRNCLKAYYLDLS